MSAPVPATPALPDWQRLVAGTLAAYWAPLQTKEDGTPLPGADLADETDFGQADHVLARLIDAGAYLPGIGADELAWLATLDLRPEQPQPCLDPALSLTLVLPRSVIHRLTQAVTQGHAPTLAVLARTMILAGLDTLTGPPATPDHDTPEEHP